MKEFQFKTRMELSGIKTLDNGDRVFRYTGLRRVKTDVLIPEGVGDTDIPEVVLVTVEPLPQSWFSRSEQEAGRPIPGENSAP